MYHIIMLLKLRLRSNHEITIFKQDEIKMGVSKLRHISFFILK